MEASKERATGDGRLVHFDSLRAIAALSVVVFHSGTESWFNWGRGLGGYTAHMEVGVTLFFLLSGYLLYRPFAAAALFGSPMPSLARYFRHRVLRILPAYWVALTVLAVWPGLEGVFTKDWWVYYGLVQTYWGSLFGGIGPAWSLSVEATFYVVLPLFSYGMLLACSRLSPSGRKALQDRTLLAIGIFGVAFNWWMRSNRWPDSIMAYWAWFALGMWLSVTRILFERSGHRPRWLDWCMRHPSLVWTGAFGAYSILAWSTMFPRPMDGLVYPGWVLTLQHVLYATTAVLVFLPAAFPSGERTFPERVLTNPVVAALGKVSYGIFLWHAPLLRAMMKAGVGNWIPSHTFASILIPTVGAAVAAGWASYVFIEEPVMRFAASLDRRSAAGAGR